MMRLILALPCFFFAATAAGETFACAHRGDKHIAPENTLPAFASAVRKGAHMIEFDVHLSKDGQPVIIHDNTVDRTTDGTGEVAELTFRELRSLDAGSWFSQEFAGTRIPTLRETLEVIPRTVLCNVHLKNAPDVATVAAEILRDMDRLEHCFLACSEAQQREAKAVVPEILCCNMSRRRSRKEYITKTIELKTEFIQLSWRSGKENLKAEAAQLHDAGIRVNWFGASEEALIRELQAAGIDYILTDNLDLCLRVLAEYGVKPAKRAEPDPIAGSVEPFPVIEDLPDPFRFQNGTRVKSEVDWRRRREEMKDLILGLEYGRMPPPPGNVRVEKEIESAIRFDGAVRYRKVLLSFGPDNRLTMTAYLYLPAEGEGPFPVLVRFGHDESKLMPLLEKGYACACFEQTGLDPDTEGYDAAGPAQAAYPEYDWGSLAVWAWGASRVMDWLETRPEIDTEKTIITGHSRTGKAALLAGALDERFAMVVPNGSGCGGAAAFRVKTEGAESLRMITLEQRFKSWFQKDFGRFGDKEERLPFDQHFLRTLVAPRFVLNTDALGDAWANLPGTVAAWMAAQPVYDFLGVPDRNRCHFREGGHDQNAEDYAVLRDAAEWYFRDKPLENDFSKRPEPAFRPGWTWKAPA
jgi:glycerophosphoryl diester phosphodiesterase